MDLDELFHAFSTDHKKLKDELRFAKDSITRLQEDQSRPGVLPEETKACEAKIDVLKTKVDWIEQVRTLFVTERSRMELHNDAGDVQEEEKLREMILLMRCFEERLKLMRALPREFFMTICKNIVSWVTQNPLSSVAGVTAAGAAGAGIATACGLHIGISTYFPALVAATCSPVAAAVAVGAVAGAIVGGLIALLCHIVTRRAVPEEGELAQRQEIDRMIKALSAASFSPSDLVCLRKFYMEMWSGDRLPSGIGECLSCFEPFESCEEAGHEHGDRCPASTGCHKHFMHARCYTEWIEKSGKGACVVCGHEAEHGPARAS